MEFKKAFYLKNKYYPTKILQKDPLAIASTAKAYKENIILTQEEKQISKTLYFFPTMQLEKDKHYGADQNWFLRKEQQAGGCGPIAAANVLASLAAQNKKMAAKLNLRFQAGEANILQKDFLILMNRVYNTMPILETPTINKKLGKENKEILKMNIPASLGTDGASFLNGIIAFGNQNGIALKSHIFIASYTQYRSGLLFIQKALIKGLPIVLLTARNAHPLWKYNSRSINLDKKEVELLKSHFVTIVGIRNTEISPQLLVSTWGHIAVIDYRQLWESWQNFSAMGAGMFYFTMGSDLKKSQRASFSAYSFFPKTIEKSVLGYIEEKKHRL